MFISLPKPKGYSSTGNLLMSYKLLRFPSLNHTFSKWFWYYTLRVNVCFSPFFCMVTKVAFLGGHPPLPDRARAIRKEISSQQLSHEHLITSGEMSSLSPLESKFYSMIIMCLKFQLSFIQCFTNKKSTSSKFTNLLKSSFP